MKTINPVRIKHILPGSAFCVKYPGESYIMQANGKIRSYTDGWVWTLEECGFNPESVCENYWGDILNPDY